MRPTPLGAPTLLSLTIVAAVLLAQQLGSGGAARARPPRATGLAGVVAVPSAAALPLLRPSPGARSPTKRGAPGDAPNPAPRDAQRDALYVFADDFEGFHFPPPGV